MRFGASPFCVWRKLESRRKVTIILPGYVPVYGDPTGSLRIHRARGGAAANGLLNNLIAYWPGNEASGNALDLHTNALHLTDVNTVTSNPGLVYPLARQYTRANTEYHTRPGDDALLSTGDVDFTIATWLYLDAKTTYQNLVTKYEGAAGRREFALAYNSILDRFVFFVSGNGTAVTQVVANNFGSPLVTTWCFVVAWHDPVSNTINANVNLGLIDSLAFAGGVFDSPSPFQIGAAAGGGTMNGRIGPTMFWKSAAGAGACLSSAQRDALWNGGAGLPYAQFTT